MITINGVTIPSGSNIGNISIKNGVMTIDGANINLDDYVDTSKKIEIKILNCQIDKMNCDNAQVWGNIKTLNSDAVTVEGDVLGNISADAVTVHGTVQGNIKADVVTQR